MKIKNISDNRLIPRFRLGVFALYFFFFLPSPWGEGLGVRCFSQGEANWWYFGDNAGLNFNGGAPAAVTNGQLSTGEGCASISDATGNLLFYTDGMRVWNKNHVQMPNGFGLMGHSSSTQSAIIIQKPGSTTIYYIFTSDAFAGSNGIRYNEIDMSLNAGLGDVTASKNILLNTLSCEKLTGIRHCNNQDIWVVTHDWNSDIFRTYLVTGTGVNTTAVLSNAGVILPPFSTEAMGQLKGSPDGNKLASSSYAYACFELFDFNNSTGIVSNAILFPPSTATYGAYTVEFSPDGTKMYGGNGNTQIYQFNLCGGSNTAIANSGILIGSSASLQTGSLQLGPDKKIYFARFNDPWLGVINSPNTLGSGCNYVDNGVSLAGKRNYYGLPNFVPYYFKQKLPPFMISVNCLTGIFTAPTVNLTSCSVSSNAITSVLWDFGDPASAGNNTSTTINPTHTFTSAGTYTVTLVLNYACGNDTIKQTVTTSSFNLTTTPTNISCNGDNNGTATVTINGGTPIAYSWLPSGGNSAAASGLSAGIYTVTVTDSNGCTQMQTTTITEPSAIGIATNITQSSCSENTGTATANVTGGIGIYTYSWSNGQITQTANSLGMGIYTVTITDGNGCTQTTQADVAINIGGLYLPNAFSPNQDEENDEFCLQGGIGYCIKEIHIRIYNQWGEKIYESHDPAFCWNGTDQEKILNSAVFVYHMKAMLISGEKIIKKGNISLIR